MNTIFYDSMVTDDHRRQALYDGQLFVYSPRKSTLAFIEFARKLIREALPFTTPDGAASAFCRAICGHSGQAKAWVHSSSRIESPMVCIFTEMGCDLQKKVF